jgi:threonylcarbamoyladenosine tRNA methylthiotransferase MtaB
VYSPEVIIEEPHGTLGTQGTWRLEDGVLTIDYVGQMPWNCTSKTTDPEIAYRLKWIDYLADIKEIVITGIHTGMYGKDLAGEYRLSNLLQSILDKCPELLRLRVSSLEENEIDDEFLALLKREPRLVDHLHIPLQSGSSKVLKDMSRHYDTEAFLEKLRRIREIRPDIAITTDVIVGYPTETEEDFKDTLAFCEAASFAEIHVFPFSMRPHTRAASLKDLSPDIKKDRVHRLLELSKKLRKEYESRFYGKQVEVLVEESYDDGTVVGHTPNYLLVRFKGDESMRNTLQFITYDSSTASD